MFSAGAGTNSDNTKDSARNAEKTGDFVCNMATWDTREQMNQSSATLPQDVDEIALTQLTPVKSRMVKSPRIAEAPVHLECKYLKTVELPGWNEKDVYKVIFGEVVGIHIEDEFITKEGLVDIAKIKPIGGLGYNDYTLTDLDSIFTLDRPA